MKRGTGLLEAGADKEASGLSLNFDEVGCSLGYDGVSFVEGSAGIVSSDAGLEGDEHGFVANKSLTFPL